MDIAPARERSANDTRDQPPAQWIGHAGC